MKKIASILLSLFMVLTLLPTTALADTGGTTDSHSSHTVCCKETGCTDPNHSSHAVLEWTSTSTLPTVSGTYYLAEDVTIPSGMPWVIGSHSENTRVDITLCLNGHTITAENKVKTEYILIENGSLTITDCKNEGTITGADGGNKKVIVVASWGGCTLNLYGGTITGINAGNSSGGGVHNEGTFNMYGGKITGNKAANGGGVDNYYNRISNSYVGKAVFNFYGGKISGNTVTDTFMTNSHDIYNQANSTMNANGGTVAGTVVNVGTIGQSAGVTTSTTFNGSVYNKKISGSGEGTGTITGGTFNGAVTNNGNITGGTFGSTVTNSGKYAKIEGGTFNGSVDNKRTNDVDAKITGGTFNGAVTNSGTISGGTFGSSGSVTNEMDGNITGGMFNGTVTSDPDKISDATVNGTMVNRYRILSWNSVGNNTVGCALDSGTNTLTLTNVHIDKLEVPRTVDITIKISGNVTINTLMYPREDSSTIDPRTVTRASSSAGSITIIGNTGRTTDTLYSGDRITSDGDLTIRDLTANLAVLSSKGSLSLENSKVTVGDGNSSGSQIGANSITMTDPSILTLNGAVIGAVGESETSNGLTGLKNFIPDGYKISAMLSARAEGTDLYTITETNGTAPVTDITLQRHYNVTFNPNGGAWNGSTEAVAKRIPINTALATYNGITAPTKGTDTFNGWFTAATGGNQVTTITADTTLYAQWTDNTLTPTDPDERPTGDDDQTSTDGSGDSQTGGDQTGGDQTGGNNRHHYVKKTDSTDANSAKTFDAGVAVYGVLAVSAVLGMGYVGKKRF